MAYDEGVAERLREYFQDRPDVTERRMFGGLAFMLGGNMCCGVLKDVLMARVGSDAYASALREPHARAMDFTGRPLTGFVSVDPEGFADDDALAHWLARCVDFAASLPPK